MTGYLTTIAVAAVLTSAAAAQSAGPKEGACYGCLAYYRNAEGKTNLLDEVGLDRDEATRTIVLNTADRGQLHVVIFYTYSTATHVIVKLSCSSDDGEFSRLAEETLETEGRNQRYLLSFDVAACKSTRVVFGGSTDANSADVITVQAVGQVTEADGERQQPFSVQ
jgi:hypothetical protein